MAKCYKLHGYPSNQANSATSFDVVVDSAPPLTMTQYQQLLSLLQACSLTPSTNLTGNDLPLSFHPSSVSEWIIHMGATNHIVCSPASLYSTSSKQPTGPVKLPTDALIPISQIGDVSLSSDLHLTNVFASHLSALIYFTLVR